MRTDVPEKVLKIARDIRGDGQANVTRLTVLKKRAASHKGKTGGEAARLWPSLARC
jgi:hypothetical protein